MRLVPSLLPLLLSLAVTTAADRPNVVMIMADDMGYECVGANGAEGYTTPHIDRLAASGVRFTDCHSQPICTPSRVKIMTGLSNARNYIRFGLLDPEAKTFGHMMRAAGYRTCVGGKWQLLGGFEGPGKFGFDEYCLWQLTRRPSRYPNPGLEVNGEAIDYPGKYGPDIVTDYLCDFMERNREQPFFVYYPMILPHWPFEPTPDSEDWDPAAKGGKGHGNPKYFPDMVAYTDKMVGKLDAKLKELGLRDNTLLIFTCDNGTATSVTSTFRGEEYPGGKGSLVNHGHHVPLVVSWPAAIREARVLDDLVDLSDMMPTIAAATGAVPPGEIDGRSFLPRLRGEAGDPREWLYIWYARNGRMGEGGSGEIVLTKELKLYRGGRLFDRADIWDRTPLTEPDAETTATQARLREVIAGFSRPDTEPPAPKPKKQKKQKGVSKKAAPKKP